MTNTICLDQNYSTTRVVAQEKPEIVNNPEDKFETVLFLPMSENRKGEGGLRTKGYFKKSYENRPLISIVTVVFNGEKYLEETIQSVINQTYNNLEYIIIDGGSKDSTIDIIKKYEDKIDYWVSESDVGIYDAMNKGIKLSSGELIGLINADDFYEANIFYDIANIYLNENIDIIYGDFYSIEKNKKDKVLAHNTGIKNKFFPYSFKWIWVNMLFGHAASFVTSKAYKKFGLYNKSFKISGDYEFFLRSYRQKANFYYIKKSIANFRIGGVSTDSNSSQLFIENEKARKLHSKIIAFLINNFLKTKLFIKGK